MGAQGRKESFHLGTAGGTSENREKLDLGGREGGWPQQGRSRQRFESREQGAIPGGPQSSQVCLDP